jgi:hypothetical protein
MQLSGRRKDEMEKIQKMFKKAKEHGDDKVSIAIQTYEMVDKHIRRLDSDSGKGPFINDGNDNVMIAYTQ